MLLIKGGHLIDPLQGIDEARDLLIENGRVSEISPSIDIGHPEGADTIIDASGLIVAPGFVDVHAHFRDPGYPEKETLHTGALSAAAGGYTSVLCMANTDPPIDEAGILKEMREKAKEEHINIYFSAAVTKGRKGRELSDMEALMSEGVPCFTDDGSPILDKKLLRSAMERAAELGAVISLHEEDPAFIGTAGVNEGKVSAMLGMKGADRRAEYSMVERDLELALETGCKLDIQHISAKESVELIRRAKARDDRGLIHGEVTPHHFSLTEEAVLSHLSLAKMNPPLRTEEDRTALCRALSDGTLDLIATDHAPHTLQEKARAFADSPSGIIGLETALSLGLKYLVEPGYLSLSGLIERMSVSPATLCSLPAGTLSKEKPADIVIFSTGEKHRYGAFNSKSLNSPFINSVLPGRIHYTICGGEIVYKA